MSDAAALDRRERIDPAGLERELTDLALAGAGWTEVLGRVRAVTGRHCRLVGVDGAALATTDGGSGLDPVTARRAAESGGGSVVAVDGWRSRAAVARIGGRPDGIVLLAEPVGTRLLDLLNAVVTAVLIESVRRGAVTIEPRYPTGAAVIAALRDGVRDDTLELGAARFGLELSAGGRAAVLAYTGARRRAWGTALTWLDRPMQHDGARAWLIVSGDDDLALVCGQVQSAVGDGAVASVRGACGSPVASGSYAGSFREADRLLGSVRGASVVGFDGAGLMQTLLAVPPRRLEWFVDEHLGPLLGRADLLMTLRIWLATNGSRQAASELLHLHRNSVGYRVSRLKSLLGVDPLEPAQSAVLQTALAAYDLVRTDSAPVR